MPVVPNGEEEVKLYELPGGSTVEVRRVPNAADYVAYVDLKGIYPNEDEIAQDIGRTELLEVTEGTLEVIHNGETVILNPGDKLQINDGDTYSINGVAKVTVYVHDEAGGTTQILKK